MLKMGVGCWRRDQDGGSGISMMEEVETSGRSGDQGGGNYSTNDGDLSGGGGQ